MRGAARDSHWVSSVSPGKERAAQEGASPPEPTSQETCPRPQRERCAMRSAPWRPGAELTRVAFSGLFVVFASACDVAPPPPSTGGVQTDASTPCGRGVAVVLSDYASTSVALVALDGT